MIGEVDVDTTSKNSSNSGPVEGGQDCRTLKDAHTQSRGQLHFCQNTQMGDSRSILSGGGNFWKRLACLYS